MENKTLESGFHSVQGRRLTMEDTHVIIDDVRKEYPQLKIFQGEKGKEVRCSYYGVYDGHGGIEAAKICQEELHANILQDENFTLEGDITKAIYNGMLKTDEKILKRSNEENWNSGSTVVLAIIVNNFLYIANAGDSEIILDKFDETTNKHLPLVLSQKHKPGDEQEKDRIKKAGGHVVFGRVMGNLAVSRALGDREFKKPYNKAEDDFVTPEPYIYKTELTKENQFLILSCDGLWDKLSYQDAIDFVVKEKNSGKSAKETSELLVKNSLDKGTLDNVDRKSVV